MTDLFVNRESSVVDLATDDQVLDRARGLDRDIREVCRRLRGVWIHLAGDLQEFHDDRHWETLGHDSFDAWLAQSDVDLQRRHAYRLIEAHRELVMRRELPPESIEDVEITKVAVVLPALKRGDVTVDDALADVRVLSRSDLADKYRGTPSAPIDATTEPELHECPDCGRVHRRAA